MELIEFKKRWNQREIGGSMEKHIDFEDAVKYITCREINADSIKMAQKINAHILECKQCRKMYNTILEFYNLGRNNSFDRDLFDSVKNLRMLIKFKIDEKINILIDHVADSLYYYDYPVLIGTRGTDSDNCKSHNVVVDENNSLNIVKIDDEFCIIDIDKDECEINTPIILITNNNGTIIFSGIMIEQDEVFRIKVPLRQSEYNVYIVTKGI